MSARPKTYHGGLPKPDRLGRWRPVVGRTQDGKTARFQVGTRKTSEADASRRLEAIRDLYDRQCAELGRDYWVGWVQCWAVKLAQGVPVLVHASSAATRNAGQAAEELSIVRQLQAWGTPIVIADDLPQLGYVALRQQIDQTVQQAIQTAVEELRSRWRGGVVEEAEQNTALPADPKTAPVGTLHGAIDHYKEYLRETGTQDGQGNLSPLTRKCREWLDMLKEHHSDCQLWQLDIGAIEKMISYWRNRPMTKRGNRSSIDHVTKMVQEIYRFLRWLDTQTKYRWTMPRGTEDLKRTPVRLAEDDKNHQTAFRSNTKETYTPEQMAVIAQHADEFGRALIGVCVNCAFGASEAGQWLTREYHLFAKHPHAAALGMEFDGRGLLDRGQATEDRHLRRASAVGRGRTGGPAVPRRSGSPAGHQQRQAVVSGAQQERPERLRQLVEEPAGPGGGDSPQISPPAVRLASRFVAQRVASRVFG